MRPSPCAIAVIAVLLSTAVGVGAGLSARPAVAQDLIGFDYSVQDLGPAGTAAYESFLAADGARAFAVSKSGDWGWVAEAPSRRVAETEARERCMKVAGDRCLVIASLVGSRPGGDAAQADGTAAAPPPASVAPALGALDRTGRRAYESFLAAEGNKAFAIGRDGAWAWQASDELPLEAVRDQAVADCAAQAGAPANGCQVAAVGLRTDDAQAID